MASLLWNVNMRDENSRPAVPHVASAWSIGNGCPDQARRDVHGWGAADQNSSVAANASGARSTEKRYRLPVEKYDSPTPGWCPQKPMRSHPSPSKVSGASSVRRMTAVSAPRTCTPDTPSGSERRNAACASRWNAPQRYASERPIGGKPPSRPTNPPEAAAEPPPPSSTTPAPPLPARTLSPHTPHA